MLSLDIVSESTLCTILFCFPDANITGLVLMILLPILALIILAFVAVFVYTKWCKKAKSRYSTTNTEGVVEMGNVDQVNYPYTQRGERGESEGKEGAVREVQTGTETDRQTDRQTERVMVTREPSCAGPLRFCIINKFTLPPPERLFFYWPRLKVAVSVINIREISNSKGELVESL